MTSATDTLHVLVELLDELAIDYAVMGGFAVRAHGVPRPTYDVDLTVALDRERLPLLFDRLRDRDFQIPRVYETGWVDRVTELPLLKLQRYIRDKTLDVDLFLAEPLFLAEAMKRRSRIDAEGKLLWVVSPEDLILLKLLAGRPRDLGDVGDVLFMQDRLNEHYMRNWASELGIAEPLEMALAESIDDRSV
jgi:predicted nucleotidyltransferase